MYIFYLFREKSYQRYLKLSIFSKVLGLIFQNHLYILAFTKAFNLFSFQFSYRLTSAFLRPTGSLALRTTKDYTVSQGHWMDILSPAVPAAAWPDYLDRSSRHPHDVGISQHLGLGNPAKEVLLGARVLLHSDKHPYGTSSTQCIPHLCSTEQNHGRHV